MVILWFASVCLQAAVWRRGKMGGGGRWEKGEGGVEEGREVGGRGMKKKG